MNRFRRWFPILAGALLVAVLAGFAIWRSASSAGPVSGTTTSASTSVSPLRSLPVLPGSAAPTLLSEAEIASAAAIRSHQVIIDRVPALMNEWHAAIVNKDANTVETLDRIFGSHPSEFIPALMTSAESDPEQRVRSFSTRVLGKLRSPESSELMRKLLRDPSEYVRFNAAWALGELADRNAVSGLRHLETRDPSLNVRRSASDSLRKINGG